MSCKTMNEHFHDWWTSCQQCGGRWEAVVAIAKEIQEVSMAADAEYIYGLKKAIELTLTVTEWPGDDDYSNTMERNALWFHDNQDFVKGLLNAIEEEK